MEIFLLLVVGYVLWWLSQSDQSQTRDPHSKSNNSLDSVDHRTKTLGTGERISEDSPARRKLEEAIALRKDVIFSYTDKFGEVTHRTITPQRLKFYRFGNGTGGTLCVEGYCHLRKAQRVFALQRIRDLHLLGE